MILKTVTILAIAAFCYGIPTEEVLKPETESPTIVTLPEKNPEGENAPLEQPDKAALPNDGKVPAAEEDSDLKTDSTHWWRSYYKYPVYSKSYYDYEYVPRTYEYTYYYVPQTYSYWKSYW